MDSATAGRFFFVRMIETTRTRTTPTPTPTPTRTTIATTIATTTATPTKMHTRKLSRSLYGLGMGLGITLGSTASLLPAQAGPGQIATYAKDTVFTQANLTALGLYRSGASNKGIAQINFTKTPGVDRIGQWTVALTLYSLSPMYGGAATGSTQYVVMGQYDATQTPHTFAPNTQANRMNNTSNGEHFGLMVEPRDAMCCAVDQSDGIWFSVRPNVYSAFPSPVRVSFAAGTPGLPMGFYVDPAPCFVDGVLTMIYTDSVSKIIMRDLKLSFTGVTMSGAEMQAVRTISTFSIRPHSATPIVDRFGAVRGLWMSQNVGNDSDMYFLPGLTAQDKAIPVYDTVSSWLNNGGICGGRLFFANYGTIGARYLAAEVGPVAWLVGSLTSLNGRATMTCGIHNPTRPLQPAITQVAMSFQLNNGVISPVPLGGFNGAFALNPPLSVFATMISTDADETAHWSQTVPNLTALIGIRISIQGLSNVAGQNPTLTNTATLEFRR